MHILLLNTQFCNMLIICLSIFHVMLLKYLAKSFNIIIYQCTDLLATIIFCFVGSTDFETSSRSIIQSNFTENNIFTTTSYHRITIDVLIKANNIPNINKELISYIRYL